MCACVPPMEAAPLTSFTTSPSCSSSQSATYRDLLPSIYPSAPPTSQYLCCRVLQTSLFPRCTHRFRLISPVFVSFPSLLHLSFQLSLLFNSLYFSLPCLYDLHLEHYMCCPGSKALLKSLLTIPIILIPLNVYFFYFINHVNPSLALPLCLDSCVGHRVENLDR